MFEVFSTRKEVHGGIQPTLRVVESAELGLPNDDLPCPWCHSPTAETDTSCPSCRRAFGGLHLSL